MSTLSILDCNERCPVLRAHNQALLEWCGERSVKWRHGVRPVTPARNAAALSYLHCNSNIGIDMFLMDRKS
ncbi:hypothetical protein J6590_035765 [Homalodisca vitripennis]|nr:hypothetical protein J6590_035765 [Homalodisca vitripennis]